MNILFDYQIFQFQNFGGISRYIYEIIARSKKDPSQNWKLHLNHSYNEYLTNYDISSHSSIFKDFHFRGKERLRTLINQWGLRKKVAQADLVHLTFFDDYYLNLYRDLKTPYSITIYDMINENFPNYFGQNDPLPAKKKKLIENAHLVLAISESTKQDILKYCHISEEKIHVIYLAYSLDNMQKTNHLNLPDDYLLFIGNRWAYKNFEKMYEAVSPILKDHSLHLLCGGGPKFSQAELKKFETDGVQSKIHHLPVHDNVTLAEIYQRARLFIFPSLYEGFGIPTLEAMSQGCAVALGDNSSLPEVAGNAGLYFDANSTDSIREVISQFLENEQKQAEIKQLSLEQAKKFSWDKTYLEHVKAFEKIVKL
ncbi:MAG: glycosyltransferase family 4 protein [Halobacteriovoraceae bacterium]|nr:glycosyltransferase family 4 protein [Halobacteriovoraceae bacterium]